MRSSGQERSSVWNKWSKCNGIVWELRKYKIEFNFLYLLRNQYLKDINFADFVLSEADPDFLIHVSVLGTTEVIFLVT